MGVWAEEWCNCNDFSKQTTQIPSSTHPDFDTDDEWQQCIDKHCKNAQVGNSLSFTLIFLFNKLASLNVFFT